MKENYGEKREGDLVTGWIQAREEDRAFLESLGVVVGKYHKFEGTNSGIFEDCKLNTDILKKLEEYKDKFIWDLKTEANRQRQKIHRERGINPVKVDTEFKGFKLKKK